MSVIFSPSLVKNSSSPLLGLITVTLVLYLREDHPLPTIPNNLPKCPFLVSTGHSVSQWFSNMP